MTKYFYNWQGKLLLLGEKICIVLGLNIFLMFHTRERTRYLSRSFKPITQILIIFFAIGTQRCNDDLLQLNISHISTVLNLLKLGTACLK